jgi:hypothetical protein
MHAHDVHKKMEEEKKRCQESITTPYWSLPVVYETICSPFVVVSLSLIDTRVVVRFNIRNDLKIIISTQPPLESTPSSSNVINESKAGIITSAETKMGAETKMSAETKMGAETEMTDTTRDASTAIVSGKPRDIGVVRTMMATEESKEATTPNVGASGAEDGVGNEGKEEKKIVQIVETAAAAEAPLAPIGCDGMVDEAGVGYEGIANTNKKDVANFAVFDAYRDFVDFRGPNYRGDLVDIAVRNYQLARERKDPENALVAFEHYSPSTRCSSVSTLFDGMEASVEKLLRLSKSGIKRLMRIYGEDVTPVLVAMSIEYPAHVADIVRSMSEKMAASVSLPPAVERPTVHCATIPNTPEEWCSEPLLV